jgi:hypothetical protein
VSAQLKHSDTSSSLRSVAGSHLNIEDQRSLVEIKSCLSSTFESKFVNYKIRSGLEPQVPNQVWPGAPSSPQ